MAGADELAANRQRRTGTECRDLSGFDSRLISIMDSWELLSEGQRRRIVEFVKLCENEASCCDKSAE